MPNAAQHQRDKARALELGYKNLQARRNARADPEGRGMTDADIALDLSRGGRRNRQLGRNAVRPTKNGLGDAAVFNRLRRHGDGLVRVSFTADGQRVPDSLVFGGGVKASTLLRQADGFGGGNRGLAKALAAQAAKQASGGGGSLGLFGDPDDLDDETTEELLDEIQRSMIFRFV